MTPGNKGKQSAVYPAVAGISVQAVAALRSGSAGAWTVPPGGLRFTQLALPFEGRAQRGVDFVKKLLYILLVFSYLMVAPVLTFDLPDQYGSYSHASNGGSPFK